MLESTVAPTIAFVVFVGSYLGLALGRVPGFRVELTRAWLILAMASTLAGNLTILGSVANLIVVEAAREARVEIGFLELVLPRGRPAHHHDVDLRLAGADRCSRVTLLTALPWDHRCVMSCGPFLRDKRADRSVPQGGAGA